MRHQRVIFILSDGRKIYATHHGEIMKWTEMEFVRYCLMPYLVRLEEEFNRKLLRHDEFEEYYYLFALNGLLRGDAKTRSEFYKNMNFVGAMSANEIRNLEDMNS